MNIFRLLLILFLLLVSGCSSVNQPIVDDTSQMERTNSPVPTKPLVLPSVTTTSQPTIMVVPTELPIQSCSPLKEFSNDELIGMISNPFNPPVQGSDDPHQGVDFSVIDPTLGYAVKGAPIQTILGGDVVMVMNDRFPYGNSLLIETSYQQLPSGWMNHLNNRPMPALFDNSPNLTCPADWDDEPLQDEQLSLFILYAHLANPSSLTIGQKVTCGEEIGEIGDSGNALAPHLHIEMRYGFSSDIIDSMAHYDVSASEDEMSNYCRWRVSGWYHLVDPTELIFDNP